MKRLNYIDCIKGLGILLVVFGHCITPGHDFALKFIYTFHLPLFFMISGYLLTYSNSWKEMSVLKNIKKMVLSLLYPYFTFSIVAIIITFIKNVIFDESYFDILLNNVFDTICFEGYTSLWFLTALFIGKTLFVSVEKSKLNSSIMYLLILLVTTVTSYYINLDTLIINELLLKFINIVNRALIGSIYIYFGYMLGKFVNRYIKFNNKLVKYLTICICSILLIVNYILSGKNGLIDLHYSVINNPFWYYYFGIVTSTCIILLFNKLDIKSKILEFYGKNSLVVMATHMPFLMIFIAKEVLNLTNMYVIFLLVMVVDTSLVWCINKFFPYMLQFSERHNNRGKFI